MLQKGAKLFKQFSTTSKKNYDIVIVGAHIGGILSRQLEKLLNNRFSVYVVYNKQHNQCNHLDIAFQQGYLTFDNYYMNVSKTLSAKVPNSDGVSLDQYLPDENSILLANGEKIGYKQLVISQGLQQDLDAIDGLRNALEDNGHPVFGPYVDTAGKVETAKKPEHYYKFQGGKSFFYIPPFPVIGEGAHYNFFAAFDKWKQNQKRYLEKTVFSDVDIEFQVINANSSFSEHSSGLNEFIVSELNNRGIKYQLNTTVNSIEKTDRQLKITNTDGEQQVEYDNFYTIIPTKGHSNLQDAGLTTSNNLLDVDQKTLQHNKYTNIFGLGDVCNLPTTRSFRASQEQLNVVRNNVFRNITGQYLNAFYSGFSKLPIYLSSNELTFFSHHYDNKKGLLSLAGSGGGLLSQLRYYNFSLTNPLLNSLYYTGNIYGPPFQFWAKSYKELERIPQEQLDKQEQQQQSIYSKFKIERKQQ